MKLHFFLIYSTYKESKSFKDPKIPWSSIEAMIGPRTKTSSEAPPLVYKQGISQNFRVVIKKKKVHQNL